MKLFYLILISGCSTASSDRGDKLHATATLNWLSVTGWMFKLLNFLLLLFCFFKIKEHMRNKQGKLCTN